MNTEYNHTVPPSTAVGNARPLRPPKVDCDPKSAGSVRDRAEESRQEVNAFFETRSVPGGVSQGTMLFVKQHFGRLGNGRGIKVDPKDCKMRGNHFKERPRPTTSLYVAEGIATERGGEQDLDKGDDDEEDEGVGLGVRLGGRRPLLHRRAHRPAPAGPGLRALRREWGVRP